MFLKTRASKLQVRLTCPCHQCWMIHYPNWIFILSTLLVGHTSRYTGLLYQLKTLHSNLVSIAKTFHILGLVRSLLYHNSILCTLSFELLYIPDHWPVNSVFIWNFYCICYHKVNFFIIDSWVGIQPPPHLTPPPPPPPRGVLNKVSGGSSWTFHPLAFYIPRFIKMLSLVLICRRTTVSPVLPGIPFRHIRWTYAIGNNHRRPLLPTCPGACEVDLSSTSQARRRKNVLFWTKPAIVGDGRAENI